MGSLVQGDDFQHILRLLNTNVDGKNKIMYAMTAIRGIGRRFSNLVCKKAEVDLRKRAGEAGAVPARVRVSGRTRGGKGVGLVPSAVPAPRPA